MKLSHKMMLLGTIPLIIVIILISLMFIAQTRSLANNEIKIIEQTLLAEKKNTLKSYIALALTAIENDYKKAKNGDKNALDNIAQTLTLLQYDDEDGYFYVYDLKGVNIAHAKQPFRIGESWIDLQDPKGNYVIKDIIAAATSGGGFTQYIWEKPSTQKLANKISYNIELKGLGWVFGTGLYVDDVTEKTEEIRANVQQSIANSLLLTSLITIISIVVIYIFTFSLNTRELGLADKRMLKLNERVLTMQEEERSRVSRELHDGVSQLITATRFDIEHARKMLKMGYAREFDGSSLDSALDKLKGVGSEIRRISHDLRPRDLDELGLFAAIEDSLSELNRRGGAIYDFEFSNYNIINSESISNSLFRIFQEAATNIEKHAKADYVSIDLQVDKRTINMKISDDGVGFNVEKHEKINIGIGLHNIRQRVEALNGRIEIQSSKYGTTTKIIIPNLA